MRSLDALASEAVATSPVRTLRAGFSLGVVDALLMRTSDKAIGDDHGLGGVLFEEGENLIANLEVGTHVEIVGEPALEWIRLAAFVAHDGDNDFRGEICGWSVEGDGGDRKIGRAHV